VELFPPPEPRAARPAAHSSEKVTIVLDDEPMLVDEGSVVVEDEVAVANVEDSATWMAADDSGNDVDVIEVGDEVVFDA
jgi:hypothetical protein